MLHLSLIAMHDAERIGRQDRQFMVGQIDDPLRVAGQRRTVARQKMFAIADADHQRAAEPRGEQHVGILAEQNRQAVSAVQLGERGA